MKFKLIRDDERPQRTYGELWLMVDDKPVELLGQTLEDTDRKLETGGEKVYGKTAIPRGLYEIKITWSNRFQKFMSEILGVNQFTGVRIHGGNSEVDTDGCPLLGSTRSMRFPFVSDCKEPNARLMELLSEAKARDEASYIEVI